MVKKEIEELMNIKGIGEKSCLKLDSEFNPEASAFSRIGLRFEPAGTDCRIGEYVDGNGNGVRASDIASGLDLGIAPGEFIGGLIPGVGFGLHSGVPDVDGSLSTGSDGLRIGSSRILTLGADGTATSDAVCAGATGPVRGQDPRDHRADPCPALSSGNGPVDNAVTDRRAEARLPRDVLNMPQATLRPGCPVDVIDLSPQGIQVQSVRPLRPDSRVLARVVVADQTVTIPAVVLRCAVWAAESESVTYRAGLRFEEVCLPVWEELARGGHLLHTPP